MTKKVTTYVPPSSDEVSEKFINYVMLDGKKTVARRIFNDMLAEIERRGNKDAKAIFFRAVENAKPSMEVRPKRIGGAVYQVPFEVNPKRQLMLSFRWILGAARKGKGSPMYRRLAQEVLAAAEGAGTSIKKREDVERMAAANRAFAHYARFARRKK